MHDSTTDNRASPYNSSIFFFLSAWEIPRQKIMFWYTCRARPTESLRYCARSDRHEWNAKNNCWFLFRTRKYEEFCERASNLMSLVNMHSHRSRHCISHWHRVSRVFIFSSETTFPLLPIVWCSAFGCFVDIVAVAKTYTHTKHKKDTKWWYNWRRRPLALGKQNRSENARHGKLAVATTVRLCSRWSFRVCCAHRRNGKIDAV